MNIRIVILLNLLALSWSFADLGQYISVDIGPIANLGHKGINSEQEVSPGGTYEGVSLDYKTNTAYILTAGYAFNLLFVEGVYAKFVDTGLRYDRYIDFKRDTQFLGVAGRLRLHWVSVRLGVGQMFVENNVQELHEDGRSTEHEFDEGEKNYMSYLYSIGLNLPLLEKLDIMLESSFFDWAQDDGDISWNSGNGTTGSEKLDRSQSVHVYSLGVRYFF